MPIMNQINLDEIKEMTLLENTLEMYSLYENKFEKGKIELRWLYVKNRDEFVKKIRKKFPTVNDGEKANFIRIYLQPCLDNNNNDLVVFAFFGDDI